MRGWEGDPKGGRHVSKVNHMLWAVSSPDWIKGGQLTIADIAHWWCGLKRQLLVARGL